MLTGGPASGIIPCRISNEPDSLLKPREMFKTITLSGPALAGLAALLAATALTVATPAHAQIGCLHDRMAFSEAQRRAEKSIS